MNTLGTTLPASCDLVRNEISVLHPCCGIEFQPLGFAPFGEIVRVNVYSNNTSALTLETFVSGLSRFQPLRVGPMEFVAILEHGADAEEVFRLEPSHSDDMYLHVDSSVLPDR